MLSASTSILTINGGSSSIKFALCQIGEALERKLVGKVDRIGLSGTNLTFNDPSQAEPGSRNIEAANHASAANFLIDRLEQQADFTHIRAVGHRVHGMQHTEPEQVSGHCWMNCTASVGTTRITFRARMNIQAPGDNAQSPVADDKRLLTMDESDCTRFTARLRKLDSMSHCLLTARWVVSWQHAGSDWQWLKHGIAQHACLRPPPARRSSYRIVECGHLAVCAAEQNQSGSTLKLILLSRVSIRWTHVV